MKCPHCHQQIDDRELARHLATKGGQAKSAAKTRACRLNARKGGWPKGKPRKVKTDENSNS